MQIYKQRQFEHTVLLKYIQGKDPCREMASKCRSPPVQEENALRQVLREAQNLDAEIKCLDFLGEKIEEKMRKRSEPADEEKVLVKRLSVLAFYKATLQRYSTTTYYVQSLV